MRSKQSGQLNWLTNAAAILTLAAAGVGSTAAFASSGQELDNNHQHVQYFDDGAWLNDIGTLLYSDIDGDGYFSGLSLSIDADSDYSSFDVYAVINISSAFDGSAGFLTEQLHTTLPFTVYGRSATDEYRVDIDLVRNYNPDIYDLQVLLVDAHDDRVLDAVDAFDLRNLSSLPLESTDNQSFDPPVSANPLNASNDDIVVTEYAGSSGLTVFALLMMAVLYRHRARRDR